MKMYTEQEMRVRADYLEGALADKKTAAMLRQAADEAKSLRAENARLKSDILELLKCLQKIYDEEYTSFGTGDVFNRISEKMNGGAK